MNRTKNARTGIYMMLAVMLVSITRRLPGTKRLSERLSTGMTTLVLAAVVLLVAAGTVSAEFACVADDGSGDAYFCGDTVTKSCTLNGSMSCTNAAQNGLIIGASDITIDGAGHKMTGNVASATCTGSQTSPCVTHSGIVNDGGWDNVVVEDLEIENFCTGVVIGTGGVTVEHMSVTDCKIHDCGKSTAPTHGIHLAGANYCNMTKNEIYNIDGTGIDAGCGGGGNGIFMHGVTDDGGDWNTITCNYLHSNKKSGFFMKYKCMHCDISHNNASDNQEGGITPMCMYSNYNTIEYNVMSNNGRCGLETQGSYNTLRYNTICNNGWYGIWIKTTDSPTPYHGINNDVFNNTLCGNPYDDIHVTNGDGSNTADSNTCDASDIGGCDWSCDTLTSVYYDYDDDGDCSKAAADCSCSNTLGVGSCCNPGLFNSSGASQHCDGVCSLAVGNDPNDCPTPSIVTYTITNTTISPNGDGVMDDTAIDVEFSESVAAAIKIENASGVIRTLYTSSSVANPDPKTWNGTDDSSNIVADGTYQVNITMDDGVNPLVYDNTRSIVVANNSVAIISIGNVSGNMTVPIIIKNAANVGSVDITLTYNASVCTITDVANGTFDWTFANLEHNETGWVRIGAIHTEESGLCGSIILANVTFRSNNTNGTSPLNLSVTTLKDATNDTNPIPYIVQNGTYTAVLNGDVNGDGDVDIADAMYLAKHVLVKSGFEELR